MKQGKGCLPILISPKNDHLARWLTAFSHQRRRMREGWLRPSLSASVRACVVRVRPSVRPPFLSSCERRSGERTTAAPSPSASPLRSESHFGGRSRMDHRCGGLSLLPIRVLGVDWHGCRLDCSWGPRRTCADYEFGKVMTLCINFENWTLKFDKHVDCWQGADRVSQAPKFDLFLDIQIHY